MKFQERFVRETNPLKVDALKEQLKIQGADGYSSMKKKELQSFLVEIMISNETKKIRMREGRNNEKERLELQFI